jgi:hypothetical protein
MDKPNFESNQVRRQHLTPESAKKLNVPYSLNK